MSSIDGTLVPESKKCHLYYFNVQGDVTGIVRGVGAGACAGFFTGGGGGGVDDVGPKPTSGAINGFAPLGTIGNYRGLIVGYTDREDLEAFILSKNGG